MEFSRQEYWSGLPFPSPEDLPNPGIEPMTFISPALAGRFVTNSATWEALHEGVGTRIQPPPHPASVRFSSVAQLCPTLCNPMNCFSPMGILQNSLWKPRTAKKHSLMNHHPASRVWHCLQFHLFYLFLLVNNSLYE